MTEVYTIRSGDTLSKLSSKYGISLKELMAINTQIDDANMIYAGQSINIPSSNGSAGGSTSGHTNADGIEWFDIARDELGTDEIPGPVHNERILEYHSTTTLNASDDETPWCSSFVNWCMEKAGIEGTDSAAARSWTRWGTKLTSPKKGCIVVYSSRRGPTSGHVGFFDRIEGNHIVTLGGNQRDSVNYSSYPKGRLLGYRWPTN